MAGRNLSPGVDIIERDASLRIETVTSSVGAVVVHSTRGPLNRPILINSTSDYLSTFGRPDDVNYKFWWTANNFLQGSNQLQVVRVEDSDKNCAGATVGTISGAGESWERLTVVPAPKKAGIYPLNYGNIVANDAPNPDFPYEGEADNPLEGPGSTELVHVFAAGAGPFYENVRFSIVSSIDYQTLLNFKEELAQTVTEDDRQELIARYWTGTPATTASAAEPLLSRAPLLREDIIIQQPKLIDGVTVDVNSVTGWEVDFGTLATYTALEYAPQPTVTGIDGSGNPILRYDEFVFYVWDELGNIAEVYLASTDRDKKDFQGNSIFGPSIVNERNNYVYLFISSSEIAAGGVDITWSVGKTNLQGADGLTGYTTQNSTIVSTTNGIPDGKTIGDLTGEIEIAWRDNFSNKEAIEVDLLLDCDYPDVVKRTLDDLAKNIRKDCFALLNVPEDVMLNVALRKPVSQVYTRIKEYIQGGGARTLNINSSYSAIYGNYFKVFDPYMEKERWIPVTGHVGATIARVDFSFAQWWAPAGLNRGVIDNVIDVAINPSKAQRDILYYNRVNPIVSFLGQGIVIWGQKTLQARPSAFDRINVRRLFLYLEKSIERFARFFIFELNDEVTRSRFANIVNSFLAEIQSQRGIFDYLVVADETNNGPDVVDRNEFVAEILIKPVRVIEFIKLIFTAVGTGVEFTELVGRG